MRRPSPRRGEVPSPAVKCFINSEIHYKKTDTRLRERKMDRIEKTIILIVILGISLIFGLAFFMIGCQTPGNVLSVNDVERVLKSDSETICLDDGFDRICVKPVPGPPGKDGIDGKDGRDGKDGQTLIAVREIPIEVIVEKIIETVVVEEVIKEVPVEKETVVVEEVIKEVPVEVVVERVVTEYADREVPIKVFVERTVEIIKEVIVEKVVEEVVFVEVPVEGIVEKIVKIPVEVPVTVTETVVVYRTPPETPPVIVENKVYDSVDYLDWVENGRPSGFHEHTFFHTHHGTRHGHRIAHPNGQQDNWDREHDGYNALAHE